MSLLSTVLAFKPQHWDSRQSYNNRRYAKIRLSPYSAEYRQIAQEFVDVRGNYDIEKIDRIQHPYAYFAFKLRKELLHQLHGRESEEKRLFFFVDGSIEDVLEYNGDKRRARLTYNNNFDADYVVVMRSLQTNPCDLRDTNWYPEYIIELQYF